MYYIYIIQSLKDSSYYKGYSEHPTKRLEEHDNKASTYTSNKVPWQLVFIQSFDSKRDALIREKKLKKYSREQIEQLISSRLNEIGSSAG